MDLFLRPPASRMGESTGDNEALDDSSTGETFLQDAPRLVESIGKPTLPVLRFTFGIVYSLHTIVLVCFIDINENFLIRDDHSLYENSLILHFARLYRK